MKINYTFKWVIQRITAFLLIPLSFWFIYQCVSFQRFDYFELELFFRSSLNSFLFILMMSAMLIHAKLGCETVVEDYVRLLYLKRLFRALINLIVLLSLLLVFGAIIRLNII